jgi:hypothetical protein
MPRPTRFEHNRFMGDKRTLRVYDLDRYGVDDSVTSAVDEVLAAETFIAFGPDTLAEARNRGYHPDPALQRRIRADLEAEQIAATGRAD